MNATVSPPARIKTIQAEFIRFIHLGEGAMFRAENSPVARPNGSEKTPTNVPFIEWVFNIL
jgi:hypothetical protein